ncbi:MAG: hypothetical protein WC666_02385 [Candidatus Paceibacterota bacterium]|jgi:uncharacterized membrane protein
MEEEKSLNQKARQQQELKKMASGLLSGKKSRISNMAAIFLIVIALIADLLTIIPFVGTLVGPLFWACIALYLWQIGCGFLNPRRLITGLISTIGEVMPAIQELPLIFVGIVLIILMVRLEDKTSASIMKKVPNNSGRKPLNQAGTRQPNGNMSMSESSQPANINGIRPPNGGLVN